MVQNTKKLELNNEIEKHFNFSPIFTWNKSPKWQRNLKLYTSISNDMRSPISLPLITNRSLVARLKVNDSSVSISSSVCSFIRYCLVNFPRVPRKLTETFNWKYDKNIIIKQ